MAPLDAASGSEPDAFDREAEFITFLLDRQLFRYANEALKELRADFPEAENRVEVVEVGVLLRQGKTAEVERILEDKTLAEDAKAQAMLLQLAMTYDAMNQRDAAMAKYQRFLELNEGKEISDPDVIRYFASAGLRLAMILQDAGKYDEAAKVLELVIQTSDGDLIKRKFGILAAQNRLDQAMEASEEERKEILTKADEATKEVMFGANDQYLQMAIGIRAWAEHLRGNTEEALRLLESVEDKSIQMEEKLEEVDVPKSEYPRALLRLVEGSIQWEQAKEALAADNEDAAKRFAARAAGNFYNTFLKYEGNPYADRAGLRFEDLNAWVEDAFGKPLRTSSGPPSSRMAALMFKRQLDLAKKLLNEGNLETAEDRLLDALAAYPETPHTPGAWDTLGRIWIEAGKEVELMALAEQFAERYPDNVIGAQALLRMGRYFAESEDLKKVEVVLGAFGRNYPSHPRAPAMLYRVAQAAAERGNHGSAVDFYDDILELYPESDFAVRVLRLRGEEALKSENIEEAVRAFAEVRDRSRNLMQTAFARLRIADAKLLSDEPELEAEALEELQALRADLEDRDSEFYLPDHREQTGTLIQNVRFRIGRELLKLAGIEKTNEVRERAAAELKSYLEEYPQTEQAPDVMYNLGRLYLQQGQFDLATRTFDRLAREYEESEAGKDALYSLVRAAIEEEQFEVAREAVQRIVAQPENFEIEKINRVAQLMLEYELWEEARTAYDLVLERPRTRENDAMRQRALAGRGEAAIGAGDLDAAVKSLRTLIAEYPTSTIVLDAGISLAEAYMAMDPPQPEEARTALSAVARVLRSRPDKAAKARLDLMLGRIAMEEGNPDSALATWYGVGLTSVDSPELADLVREAIRLSIEEARRQIAAGDEKRWNLIIELTDQYLKNFPMDTDAEEMRSLNIRAIGMAPNE